MQRQAAERRHYVVHLGARQRVHCDRQALHHRVHLQVQRARELDVGCEVAEGDDLQRL